MIIFENSGEIDPRLATLIGVNIKENPSAIGYFGTGLKYAIASLTRWNESITLQSGPAEFTFSAETTSIRGKEFGLITMFGKHDKTTLGFTTELGKNWAPWMVYRELWSNAKDEPNCNIYETQTKPKPEANVTRIIVSGPNIQEAHEDRSNFLLENQTPLFTMPGIEIYPNANVNIFYRGIAVQRLNKNSLFTYNITNSLSLTEDRTADTWSTDNIIVQNIAMLQDEETLTKILTAPETAMESRLDYFWVSSVSMGSLWSRISLKLAHSRPLDVHASIRKLFLPPDAVKICPTCNRPL